MKKLLLGGGILFCIILVGLSVYRKLTSDRTAPQIIFGTEIVYSEGMTNEDLLVNVTAIDPEEGDVSESLVIESVTADIHENAVIVVYAARDSKNNIAKIRKIVPSSDNITEKLSGKEAETEMSSRLDGTDEFIDALSTDDIEAESEEVSETESEYESEIEEVESGHPVIKLNANRAVIRKGDTFDPLIYISSIEDDYDNIYSLWRDIRVEGEYDTDKVGVYEFAFYVVDSAGNRSNTAHFKLTVKE